MSFDFDRIAEDFDSTRSFDPRLIDTVADAIRAVLGPRASVLDIGCGTGRFLLPFTRKDIRAVGIDISKKMLVKAKGKGLDDIVRGEASHLPFKDDGFDAAFMSSVLHLLADWKGALKEACRVSRRAVISLDSGIDRNDNPHDMFKAIMRKKGLVVPQMGPYESELCDACHPDRRIPLLPFVETRDRGELLAAFEKRTFTYQAGLTPEQNRECLRELSRILTDEKIDIRWKPALIVWEPEKLETDIEKATFCYPH